MNYVYYTLEALLILCGAYLVYTYTDTKESTPEERHLNKLKRSAGYLFILVAIAAIVYTQYTTVSAQLASDCSVCKTYIDRTKAARPYSKSELGVLKRQADSCNNCSKMCFDEIELLQKYNPKNAGEINVKKTACMNTTKHAILAKKELNRLQERIAAERVGDWRRAKAVNIFPDIPE